MKAFQSAQSNLGAGGALLVMIKISCLLIVVHLHVVLYCSAAQDTLVMRRTRVAIVRLILCAVRDRTYCSIVLNSR